MDYKFKIDVSHLVEKVKKHNMLFYPVMVHIFTSVLSQSRKSEASTICPAYTLQRANGTSVTLWNEGEDSFPHFFEKYVKNCYRYIDTEKSVSLNDFPANSVYVSFLPPQKKCLMNNGCPEFYLSAFEVSGGRTMLPVVLKSEQEFSCLESFIKSCQKMCDMFHDWN